MLGFSENSHDFLVEAHFSFVTMCRCDLILMETITGLPSLPAVAFEDARPDTLLGVDFMQFKKGHLISIKPVS